MTKRADRDLKRELERMGLSQIRIDRSTRHRTLWFEANGVIHRLQVAKTPSDHRTMKNELARVKRLIKETA